MRTRLAAWVVAAALGLVGTPGLAGPALAATGSPNAAERIVFAAFTRGADGKPVGSQALYTAAGDGSGLSRISPDDGLFYDWPVWAMNGNALVFSAGRSDSVEQRIYLAAPDGSGRRPLVNAPWQSAQPKISPDGRTLLFSSQWSEYPKVGVYRADLATLLVQNLSAESFGAGLDGDPRFSADGRQVVFASSFTAAGPAGGPSNTQIYLMNADGTGRVRLTHDAFFDTDPALSPDGRFVAYSSYQGPDQPVPGKPNNGFVFPVADWHLMVLDLSTGATRSLTGGKDCTRVDPTRPCRPDEGPAWVPVWSPDGSRIGYQSIVSPVVSGIYVTDFDAAAGSAKPILEGSRFAIGYWDWTRPANPPAGALDRIGRAMPSDRLLFGGSVFDSGRIPPPSIFRSGPDRWNPDRIELEDGSLAPTFARWFPDRRHIIFTARVPYDGNQPAYGPEPPAGQHRREHFTLDELNNVFVAPPQPPQVAEQQVFMMDSDGSHVRQLSTPWTEDYMDAIRGGDARGNAEPDVSPDGRYVIFTNVSTLRYESFILRLDLRTGEVANLTNVTAGATPTADSQARWSPDGRHIAFASVVGGDARIYVMDADGQNVQLLTDDDWYSAFPTWSPDGSALAFSSYRGGGLPQVETDSLERELVAGQLRLDSWYLVRMDVASRAQTVLTRAEDSPPLRPVWSPDGSSIAYITIGRTLAPDIYVVPAGGGRARPLQLTILSKEEYVDWR
ncbi:MAG TPA: hypothetical protein VK131_10720 [Candidatus Acidoferrales bacterium]|nr:hypothetical protein [Candidatus Acidoferrales bacterium]